GTYWPILESYTEDGQYIISTDKPDDWVKVGNGLPKGEAGFANNFSYQQWNLSFFFRGVWGHTLYNSFRGFYETADSGSNAYNSVITDKTPTDPLVTSQPIYNSSYVENASFIKLDNLELGRNFKTNSPNISSLRVYFAAQNVSTIAGYTGIDPEARLTDTNASNGFTSALSPGIERMSTYFQTRSFTLG